MRGCVVVREVLLECVIVRARYCHGVLITWCSLIRCTDRISYRQDKSLMEYIVVVVCHQQSGSCNT